jgi:pilus assembly protein CpaB
MRPGNIFLLAVLVGALASALIVRHVRRLESEIDAIRGSANRPTVDVVVANDTIPIGARVEPNQVRAVAWPVEAQPEGTISDPKGVVGNILRTTVERNQPILQSEIIAQGAGLLPLMIPEGMRGMSVRVDTVTGVSGFITPNSRVDVVISGTPEGETDQRGKVVLQNVKVLAIGKTIEQKDEKPVEVPTVTLLVTPEDAERLTLATRYEPVRLALRNYRDEEVVRTTGIATKALFQGDGHPVVAQNGKPQPRAKGPAPYSVEILLGEKLTRQPLF